MTPNRRTLFGAVVVGTLALFVLASSGLVLAQGSGPSLDDGGNDDSVTASNVSLSEAEATDIATAEADGTVEEVELEGEDGTPVYEVELVGSDGSETEITVHADDGTVLETESENEDENEEMEDENEEMEDENEEMEDENEEMEDKNEEMEDENEESVAPGDVSLSEAEATNIATAEADGTVEEVELEGEDGTPVYEVELVGSDGSETEITVHADDGTVLGVDSADE
jgi:uncharacterized membrane protein YkoI